MDVRREFSWWLADRQETALEEEDAGVLRFKADELFKHERYYRAYRFYWQLKDEDGKRKVFAALCRGEPDVRKLALAGMIAKDSGYAMTEIFSIYFSIGTVGSLREAYDLAEDIKILKLQKKCIWALILKTQRSWHCREYLIRAIKLFIGCRDSENLNELYPYLEKMRLTEECIKCAEFLGDKKKLMKIARRSFSWFSWFRGKDPDRALKIWKKLGYEKGLKEIQRWAKRRLDERVYSYWQACVALGDEDGKKELFEMIVNGPLWNFSKFFWEEEIDDLEARRSLARSALARGETEVALSWFVKISDKDGIVAALDEVIKKNKIDINLWRAGAASGGDARVISRLKEVYIMRGDAHAAELCAKEMGQALTRGEYCRIAEAERRKRGFVWEETAKKADIILTSEDWLAKARFLVGTGGLDEDVKEALKRAEDRRLKEVKENSE